MNVQLDGRKPSLHIDTESLQLAFTFSFGSREEGGALAKDVNIQIKLKNQRRSFP